MTAPGRGCQRGEPAGRPSTAASPPPPSACPRLPDVVGILRLDCPASAHYHPPTLARVLHGAQPPPHPSISDHLLSSPLCPLFPSLPPPVSLPLITTKSSLLPSLPSQEPTLAPFPRLLTLPPASFPFTLRGSVLSPCLLPPSVLLSCPSFSQCPLPTPFLGPLSQAQEKGAREWARCWACWELPGWPSKSHPTCSGEEGGLGAHHVHRRPSCAEEPRAARPSQAILAKPRSGAMTRPANSPHLPLQHCPSLRSQEGHCIWPEQNR